jgi:hypothetical protein
MNGVTQKNYIIILWDDRNYTIPQVSFFYFESLTEALELFFDKSNPRDKIKCGIHYIVLLYETNGNFEYHVSGPLNERPLLFAFTDAYLESGKDFENLYLIENQKPDILIK